MTDDVKTFTNPDSFHAQLKAVKPENTPETTIENIEPSEEVVNEPEENEIEAPKELSDEEENKSEEEQLQPTKKENKYVPRSRLKEETEKRTALETQLMKEREDRIRIETQLQMIQQARSLQETQSNIEPDLDHIDPLDQESHQIYSKEIKRLKEEINRISAQTSKQTQDMHYYNTATAQEAAFEKDNPDYKEAIKHLAEVETYDAELEHGNSQDSRRLAGMKLEKIVKNTLNQGGNAAEILYKMAVKKGYQPFKGNKGEIKRTSNLDAINGNMKKSASVANIGTNAGMSTTENSFSAEKMLKDPKNPRSKFDPAKFHQYLKKVV